MYGNVLVLLDGSDASQIVLQYVPSFVSSAGGERVTLFRVLEDPRGGSDSVRQYLGRCAERLASAWNRDLSPLPDIQVATVLLQQGPVADAIVDYASQNGLDVIMLSTRGWSGADWWSTGSVAQHVIRESTVPLFAARLRGGRYARPGIVKKVLVPVDGSSLAEEVLPYAERIAVNANADVTLLHVLAQGRPGVSPAGPQSSTPDQGDVRQYLAAISQKLSIPAQKVATVVRRGLPGQQIAEMAQDEHFDLIVMSSHGHTGPGQGAFGGVTEGVLHGCHVPILVIPHRIRPVPAAS